MQRTRILTHGWAVVCLLAAATASAQEVKTTHHFSRPGAPKAAATQTITQTSYSSAHNPYAYYEPGVYMYPNYPEPNRGYVYFGYTGRECCSKLGCRWQDRWRDWRQGAAERRANFGARFRCSMGFLRPLTYWDIGFQKDAIAVDPNYAHPADVGGYYAAQGYGVPVTVPLPPSVRDGYNYSWGLPGSRLTPLSTPAGY